MGTRFAGVKGAFMTIRIRIVRMPPSPENDGIRFDLFQSSREYEVGNSLGALFLAEDWAEPVVLHAEAPVVPFTENDPDDSWGLYRDRELPPQKETSASPSPITPPAITTDMFRFTRRSRQRQS